MRISVYDFLFEQVEQQAKKSRFEVLHQKFVEELKKLTTQQLIDIGKADPTSQNKDAGEKMKMGSYSQWLLKQYLKILPEKFDATKQINRVDRKIELFWEDLYKTEDWLTKFNRFSKRIEDPTKRDINKVDSLRELQMLVKDFTIEDKSKAAKIEKRNYEVVNNVDYHYNDGEWEVITPKTWQASKAVALNPEVTEWCTAAASYEGHFTSYSGKGPLYIIRDLKDILKTGTCAGQPRPLYQFHFETDSFMDRYDHDINVAGFLRDKPGLTKFFKPIFEKFLETQAARRGGNNDVMNNRIFRTYVALFGMDDNTQQMVLRLLKAKVESAGETLEVAHSSYGAFVEMLGLEHFINVLFEYAGTNVQRLELLLETEGQGVHIPESLGKFVNAELCSIENIALSIPASIINLKQLQLLNVSGNANMTSLPQLPLDSLTVINISNSGVQLEDYLQERIENGDLFLIE